MTENPLLDTSGLPRFADIRNEHVEPAIRELLTEQRSAVKRIESLPNPSFETVVLPLEEMRHRLGRVWSPVSHLNGVLNSDGLRAAYNACLPLLSDFHTDMAQSEKLYQFYRDIEQREAARLNEVQREVLTQALRNFRLAGVALDPVRKARFKAVMMELSQLGARFEENVLDATNAWSHHVTDGTQVRGINAGLVEQAAANARDKQLDGWLFGLDQPTYVAVVTDCESPAMRRMFYEAWSTRASDRGPTAGKYDNTPVMAQILKLRHEAALLLDFGNYAELALADRMAKSVPEVLEFLRNLAVAARPAAQRDLAELEAFAGRKLDAWDVAFYSERLQQQRFSISQEELRNYLPLPRVLGGLFEVATKLYGVTVRERTGIQLWHADARYFDVLDERNAAVASFYLDACARPHKRSGAWMDDCIGRKQLGDTTTLPVAYLICNSLPAQGDRPAQLTHDDVVTLFHEFGHGLHHMLTRVGYPSVSGISGVAWDAVELPSQFMENFAWLPEVLAQVTSRAGTGEALPADKQQKLIATRSFQAGLMTMRQLEFSLFDMRMHAEYDPARGGRIYEILEEVRSEVAVIKPPEWQRFPHNFSHVFAGGYAAGYYSYKWAEVLAADAFAAFSEQGVFDRATARRFLDSVLSRGGSRDALTNFVEFRGRKPAIDALLKLYDMAA
jgi:oligopeptidase A